MKLFRVTIQNRSFVATGFKKTMPYRLKNSKSNKEPRANYEIYLANGGVITTNQRFSYETFVEQPKKKKR